MGPQQLWILIFFSEIAKDRSGVMQQLVNKRGLWEPYFKHCSPQYSDKGGEKKCTNHNELVFEKIETKINYKI